MPGDPNRISNLVGMSRGDHNMVTQSWNAWRRGLGGEIPSAARIMQKAIEVDKEFGHLMAFLR